MNYRIFTALFVCLSLCVPSLVAAADQQAEVDEKYKPSTTTHSRVLASVDHSKFKILQQKFTSGDAVTKACASCHTNVVSDIKKSAHWTWRSPDDPSKGKSGFSLNNYCISANDTTDKACYSCHIGWKGKEGEANCLVCHGQAIMNWSESIDDAAAMEAEDDEESLEIAAEVREELNASIANLGKPRIENCGKCHFNGGGGNGTKHGDLDTSLIKASRNLDVHMSADGGDMSCVDCHTTSHHNIAGRDYDKPASDIAHRKSLVEDHTASRINCISCHSEVPHEDKRINDHATIIACQTCHVPTLAPVLPTQTEWDWSTAGKLKDGKPYADYGKYEKWHRAEYKSIKGNFVWEKNVVPAYMWYDGSFTTMTLKDKFDPADAPIAINKPQGQPFATGSKIAPFKDHIATMPYDKVNNNFVGPLLSTPKGFWTNFDMHEAVRLGHEALGLEFSGELEYVKTNFYYPTPHMVRPAEDALSCIDCHSKNGRLQNVAGIYMPNNHGNKYLDIFGAFLVIASIFGVALHGLLRFIMSRKRKG